MSMKIFALASVIAISGCAHEVGLPEFYPEQTKEKFGAAVRQNIAAQTVNPDGATGELTASGERTAKAIEAYEADKVEKPKASSTLSATQETGPGNSGN